ncbi:MAG: hypothetical protein MUE44_33170 [Oscillatoriaceae cyanobacterium Prado104]|jgi:hypothetical protein|nr:hypothetical protein [Oscillatoriaceae cyanobacterium Prado104]
MFEKLLLAAALTLSVQIFAGASPSAKLPKSYVFRSLLSPVTLLKPPTRCSTIVCSDDRPQGIFSVTESATYTH